MVFDAACVGSRVMFGFCLQTVLSVPFYRRLTKYRLEREAQEVDAILAQRVAFPYFLPCDNGTVGPKPRE